ncbi:MAG: TFIIB-type zinc ribbon-containing protein [Bacteroidales bacterium]
MATSYKCPNCSANLLFDADQQLMTCGFCGAKISPEDIVSNEVYLNSEAMKQEAARDEEISSKPEAAVAASGAEATGEDSEAQGVETAEPEFFAEEETVQFVCNSCGAAVITDSNTSATFCAFCGSPAIIPERLVDARKPDYVLPFKYGRDNAIDSFFKWCKAGRFTPVDFVKNENIEKMTGLYVPFWLYNSVVDMDYETTGTKVSSSSSGNKTTTTTKYYLVKRKRKVCWSMIPFDGATHIDDAQMEMIAPYDYKALKKFDMLYLSGFFADRYDLPAERLEDNLTKKVNSYVDRVFLDSIRSYGSVTETQNRTKIYKPDVKYALLPVWILNYKYLGKMYTFAMNGQTGKIAGQYPISRLKLILLGLAILPVAAVLFKLVVGGLILGGFF